MYCWMNIPNPFFNNMSIKIMRSYEWVYVAGYVFLAITAVETLRRAKR